VIMLGENISLAFESGYDIDATVASTPAQPVYSPPSPPRQTYVPPAQPVRGQVTPPPPPAYSGQIPQSPLEPSYEVEPETQGTNRRTLIIAGCGCLLVAVCVLVAGMFAVDSLNMWCEVPFRWIQLPSTADRRGSVSIALDLPFPFEAINLQAIGRQGSPIYGGRRDINGLA
jgi:hypothetical protein